MKALLFTTLLLLSTMTHAYQCKALSDNGFSPTQIDVMYQSFQYGVDRGWGYSLAAISFRESSAGNPKFMRNPNDPSAGYHGVVLSHVLNYFKMKDTPTNNRIAEDMLMNSHGASAWFAMGVLDYWNKYHNGNWTKTIRSYNGGHYWREGRESVEVRTANYFNDVHEVVKMLKTCNWE